MKITSSIEHSALLAHLAADEVDFLGSVAREVTFQVNDIVFEEDGDADTFFIIRSGRIGLELTSPRRRPIVIQTMGRGDLVGLSWFFPPFRWSWRARALDETAAVAFDAARVRERCDEDAHLALEVLRIVSQQAVARLHSSRTQMLDLYEFPR